MPVLNLNCAVSADDAEQNIFGQAFITNTTAFMGRSRGLPQHAGFRFPAVAGMASALVNTAVLTLLPVATQSVKGNIGTFKVENGAAPGVFTTGTNDITGRAFVETVTCRANAVDFDTWTVAVPNTFDIAGNGDSLKAVLQELIDIGTDPSVIVLAWIDGGSGGGELEYDTVDGGGPTLAAQFDIDLDAGGGPIVTGAGDIDAAVTVVGAGGLLQSGAGGIDVTATLVGAGDVGALLEGQGAIAVAVTVVGAAERQPGGKAQIDAAVTLVGAGERIHNAAGAIDVAVTVTGRGELGGTLEATGAINVGVTLVGAGERQPGGKGAIDAAVTVVGAGILENVVGAGDISAAVTVTGLGETGVVLFTIFGHPVELDPDDMPEDHTKFWIAVLSAPAGGTARNRMFNITLGTEVAGTELTTTSVSPTRLISGSTITLPSGPHLYRAEYGGATGFIYKANSAKLRVFNIEPPS